MDVSAKIIDTFLSLDKHIRYSEEHGIVFDTDFCEAVECVVLVFRKKLEMDCVVKPRTTYNGYTRYKDYYCPVCGKQQKAKSWSGSKREQVGWYCERCGQKLKRGADNG